jgi:hypothetical protein
MSLLLAGLKVGQLLGLVIPSLLQPVDEPGLFLALASRACRGNLGQRCWDNNI